MQNMLKNLSSEEQDYKAVHVDKQDSDEELHQQSDKNPKLVIEEDEEMKEVKQVNHPQEDKPEVKIQQQKQQQQSQPFKQVVEQTFPKLINYDFQDINVKIKKEWLDRVKNPEPPKFEKRGQVEIKEPVLFTMDKNQPKHGRSFFTSLFSADYRYLYIIEGYIYVLQMKNDKMFVKSVYSLKRLFKIIVKSDQIQLCYLNSQLDKMHSPKVKTYKFLKGNEQKGKLLMRLRTELNKLGQDFDIMK